MKRLITRKRFIEWLKAQPVKRTFLRRKETSCPLAACLKDVHKKAGYVSPFWWGVGDEGTFTPDWAARFVHRVDEGSGRKITAREALTLIK